ncbi:protein disulfide-isomerase [Populus alba x Populus x berolinensis]|nr:protein disulfide-isomerase [Populus alba x Populus x berolinensis]
MKTRLIMLQSEKILSHVSLAVVVVPRSADFAWGTGSVAVELGGDDKEVSPCINCEGVGSLTCTTCQGSGIQPRYLDRREFKDDD